MSRRGSRGGSFHAGDRVAVRARLGWVWMGVLDHFNAEGDAVVHVYPYGSRTIVACPDDLLRAPRLREAHPTSTQDTAPVQVAV
jgi:hypothetical protein